MKRVMDGILIQDIDNKLFNEEDFKVVSEKHPTKEQIKQLIFAYKVVKHTKSNAIVLANGNGTVGIGVGQTNRVWATMQSLDNARGKSEGAVMASDAFFPFSDCVEYAAKAGIKAIIQPGGSIRDKDSIDMCNKYNIAMVFCGTRHFKH